MSQDARACAPRHARLLAAGTGASTLSPRDRGSTAPGPRTEPRPRSPGSSTRRAGADTGGALKRAWKRPSFTSRTDSPAQRTVSGRRSRLPRGITASVAIVNRRESPPRRVVHRPARPGDLEIVAVGVWRGPLAGGENALVGTSWASDTRARRGDAERGSSRWRGRGHGERSLRRRRRAEVTSPGWATAERMRRPARPGAREDE